MFSSIHLINVYLPGTIKGIERQGSQTDLTSKTLSEICHQCSYMTLSYFKSLQFCRKVVVFLLQPTSKSRWSEGGMEVGPHNPQELFKISSPK